MEAFTAGRSKEQKDEEPQTTPRDPLLSVLPVLFRNLVLHNSDAWPFVHPHWLLVFRLYLMAWVIKHSNPSCTQPRYYTQHICA